MQSQVTSALESGRYPEWLVNVVADTREAACAVTQHGTWSQFRFGTISKAEHQAMLIRFWPVFERFPKFVALNLLKCDYGADPTMNAVRGWLLKNLRNEQWLPGMYRDWAVSAGIDEQTLFQTVESKGTRALADWCWQVSEKEGMAESIAAIMFVIQGLTCEWMTMLWENEGYQLLFEKSERTTALRWIQSQSATGQHNVPEVLDVLHELLGDNPDAQEVHRIKEAMQKSYELYLSVLDEVVGHG